MNYISRYGLEFNPFIKNEKDMLVETNEYKEVVFRLDYLLQLKGFGLLTGGPGRGKTTAVRFWANRLNEAAYKVIYLSLSTLTVIEFYKQLVMELGIEAQHRKIDNFRAIQSAINRYVIEKRITPVIIIDEANYLNYALLNDLKIIFNFDMDSKDRAIILLVGLPQLNHTLNLTVHEPLKQRIVMNYHIESLNKEEAKQYLIEKLSSAGCHQKVFEDRAIEAIINASNGIPRVINRICDRCLLLGNNQNQTMINSDTVMSIVNDIALV